MAARNAFFPVHIVIEISERVEVPAAPRIVWDVLSDPRAVVELHAGGQTGRPAGGRLVRCDRDGEVRTGQSDFSREGRAGAGWHSDDRARILARQGRPGRYAGENGDDLQGRGGAGTGLVGRSHRRAGRDFRPARLAGGVRRRAGGQAHDGRIHGAARRARAPRRPRRTLRGRGTRCGIRRKSRCEIRDAR